MLARLPFVRRCANFAVDWGCKCFNGGPDTPAFAWVNSRHTKRFWQPLSGWWGHATGACAIVRALIACGLIGDFRAEDALTGLERTVNLEIRRCGFTPLYIGFEKVWRAVEHLRQGL